METGKLKGSGSLDPVRRFTGRAFLALGIIGLVACTEVPFDAPKTVTEAAPAEGTEAYEIATNLAGGTEDGIALVPLQGGNDALGARLRLIGQAERAIDIKTFLVKPDASGALVWLALFDAAERGIRVRLLIDDVFTTANDEQIASLDAHPNVEIRYFNPLSRNAPKFVNFLFDFGRVNRRMHNKAMIVDGSLAIIGGRNYANEYYQIGTESEFADFDLFVAGKPVEELSDAFDLYWNDQWALPVAAFVENDEESLQEARDFLARVKSSDAAKRYQEATLSTFVADLKARNVPLFKGEGRVIVDDPDKLRKKPSEGPYKVANELYATMEKAESDVLVLTPYFVPEDYGAEVFEKLVERGVRVRIVTNSLAATNHAYVHGAYAKYRDRLLDAGVEFIEVRSDAPALVQGEEAPLTMHTKLAVVDGDTVFVGSTNIDPRSIRQNTEIGMVIQSPGLAQSITNRVDEAADSYGFTVTTDENGRTRWFYNSDTLKEEYDSEPNAGFWRRIVATVSGWLPIESQL